jgi:hypothetical protein
MTLNRTRVGLCAAALLLTTAAHAGDKKLMHCFAFTSIKEATPADWNGFFKASDALPSKIKGITKVSYGKLTSPLTQFNVNADAEAQKKLRAGDTVTAPVKRVVRDWGMCMEMANEAALKAYDTDPYHQVWVDAYSKVRVEGTTTFNIIGQ